MRFTELCRKVLEVYDRYAAENGIEVNEDYAMLKLVEEVGEFSQAVIIQRGMCRTEKRVSPKQAQRAVAAELSDILGLTIVCADRMGVDLQGAIRDKWLHFLDEPAKLRGRASTVVSKKRTRSRPSKRGTRG
jgi:NTP pyrophosphatase (non-canonical NTP hydrolase)